MRALEVGIAVLWVSASEEIVDRCDEGPGRGKMERTKREMDGRRTGDDGYPIAVPARLLRPVVWYTNLYEGLCVLEHGGKFVKY
jgi:hypothetical protein